MEREYKCIDCGGTFVLDTQLKCGAKRCPECKKIHIRESNKANRERYKKLAFDKMKKKPFSFSFLTIAEDEIRNDFQRFLRQEAMRANCYQEDIMKILNLPIGLKIK